MKRVLAALTIAALAGLQGATPAHAQTTIAGLTVASCGAQSFPASEFYPLEMLQNGNLCTNASGGGGSTNATIVGPLGVQTVPNSVSTTLNGGSSNASSGVATSTTNTPVVSWLFAFNGSTWDQVYGTGTPNFALRIDDVASNNQLHTDLTSPIAAQTTAAVPIGGTVICDGASTANPCAPAATVKAASTLPAATDKSLVVGLNPGSATAGSPTGAIVTVQGVASMTPVQTQPFTSNNAAAQGHICSKHAFVTFSTNTDTQLVAASGSTTIYICDYSFSLNGATNIYLEKATSGTCATLTQLDQVWYGAANVAKGITNPFYSGLNTGASAQLCVNSSGSSVSGSVGVNYDQY
jgi:hypothetical protein